MYNVNEEVFAFLNNPLPLKILDILFDTVEIFGALKGIMMYGSFDSFDEIRFIKELRIINALDGTDYEYLGILLGTSCKDVNNAINTQRYIFDNCKRYASDQMEKYNMIPVIDLLRINSCIGKQNLAPLTESHLPEAYQSFVKKLDDIFRVIFGVENNHHIFIRIAVAEYLFRTCVKDYKIEILAFDILFSTLMAKNNILPPVSIWLAKYTLLNTNWGYTAPNFSIEQMVIKFLNYLNGEFRDSCLLIKNINSKTEIIDTDLRNKLPKIYTKKLSDLLCNKLCLRNNDLVDLLHVTPKTAIGYMKKLEEERFICGYRAGHEKLYVNNYLFFLIQE